MNRRGKNGVYTPSVNVPQNDFGSRIIDELHKISPVLINAVFDDEETPIVTLQTGRSSEALDLLKRVNLNRGTVIGVTLKIRFSDGDRWEDLNPAALARLNWFLHEKGHSKGFRGWRVGLEKDCGLVIARSAATWKELLKIIKA